ncbi:hydrolase [Rheinheimera aquimaris]|uniref:hydrolase n=1 Tax=Rheinheimera aquimaris TaxID=412437 RepID=UPI000E8E998D|nr:hydrolase [Rheinheimera aquimaris]MCD1599170.1 hydrolase [Rheinheimera aquimaris]HBN89617.1 hydrolase [Rheinheimera sp.]|tara:strand:- start:90 stop:635 length:546 start_codon:yes stop_codon:yes gene_type:complete
MLLKAEHSLVLLIDMQQKLSPAIFEHKEVEQAAAWVLQVAIQLDVPVWATEQYPQGLGPTVPALAELVQPAQMLQKMHFSALKEPHIASSLACAERKQVVVLGTETHVCVLQSVFDLLDLGYQVFVVTEAVGSRTEQNKQLALSRMQQAGAQIISKEMLAFEWLQCCGTDTFRQISKGWIR